MSRTWLRIAAFAIAFRLFSAALAFVLNVVFPDYRPQQFDSPFRETTLFWETFTRHDSGWYFDIARNGYHYTPGGRDNIAFFPAYPLLMRHVGRLFGPRPSDLYFGGIAISWVAFALAMIGLYHLARLELPRRRAGRAVLLAAVFPFAFFFGAVYTEALFLAATIGAFYFFRTRRWIAGGLCGALATATRVNGILIWPALAWIAWRAVRPPREPAGRRSGEADLRIATANATGAAPDGLDDRRGHPTWNRREAMLAAAGLLLVPAGVGLYSLFIYQFTGNPLEWAAAIQRWGYYPGGEPWLALVRLLRTLATRPYAFLTVEPGAPYDTLNGLTAIVFVVATPFVWMRLGTAYGLFMAANLWLPLSSGQYEGMGRYCAVLFPFFIWVAALRPRWIYTLAVVWSAMLYTLALGLFTNIHPLF